MTRARPLARVAAALALLCAAEPGARAQAVRPSAPATVAPPPAPNTPAPPPPPARAPYLAQFAGDAQHTGRSPYRGPRRAPVVAWRVRAVHRVFASPLLSRDERIVFAGSDGMVHAVDRAGVERWAFAAPGPVFATPAAVGALVLVGHDGGGLVALDARGQRAWAFAAGEDVDAAPLLAPDGATVYVASRGLAALAAGDGASRWRAAAATHVFGPPALARDGATAYVADLSGELLYVRTRDGHVERRVRVGAPVHGGVLVLDDGAVVVGASDGHVRAFAPDGAPRWDFTTRDEVRSTPALARDGATVIVGSDDGGIYGLRATDGTQVFRAATSGRVRSSARIDAEGWAYVGSEDDTLYALDARGAVAWSVTLGADIDSSALVTPWGSLAVGCDDGGLYHLVEGAP